MLTYQATDLFTGGEESSFGDSTGRDETKIERIRRQETETAIFRRNNDPLLHRTRHATRGILLLYQKLDTCVFELSASEATHRCLWMLEETFPCVLIFLPLKFMQINRDVSSFKNPITGLMETLT